MSLIIGNGMLLQYGETEITCPICQQKFDAAEKMAKAKNPVFNTKCPHCKGKITISEPIFGGELKCWETNCPKTVKRMETVTPNKVNGVEVPLIDSSKYNENDDEGDDDGDATTPVKR